MVNTVSAAVFGSCFLDAVIIESKEAGFMVLGPWVIAPAEGAFTPGVLAGGTVLPPQYKKAINTIATAIVI